MPRLPERYRTRLGYSLVSGLSGMAFSLLFFLSQDLRIDGQVQWDQLHLSALFGLGALPAAALMWPRQRPRRPLQMVVRGALTVMLSFAFLGIGIGLLDMVMGNHSLVDTLAFFVTGTLAFVILGSVFTFGLPYLIACLLSVMFADDPEAELQ